MPSIEIVCVGQEQPSDVPDYPFAVVSSTDLLSHRGPSSLFQRDFNQLRGCMYHLGNPECSASDYQGPFFAYELLRDEQPEAIRLQFSAEYQETIKGLLLRLLRESPDGQVLFTTDWQAGPERPIRAGMVSWARFWAMHDAGELRLNTSYIIHENS